MDVVKVYWSLLALVLIWTFLQERWKLGTLLGDYTLHLVGMCWIAMMRHTGDPRYCHTPRRYRA